MEKETKVVHLYGVVIVQLVALVPQMEVVLLFQIH